VAVRALILLVSLVAAIFCTPTWGSAAEKLDPPASTEPLALPAWGGVMPNLAERLRVGDTYGIRQVFEPDVVLTTAGLGLKSGGSVLFSPQFGVGHVTQQRELGRGYEDVLHRLHARAGGTLHLSDSIYLSAATKIPLYNYEFTDLRTTGGATFLSGSGKHDYELFRLPAATLTWSGEMGVKLGRRVDFNLFYDQNLLKEQWMSGATQQEEVIGTRFIIRFK